MKNLIVVYGALFLFACSGEKSSQQIQQTQNLNSDSVVGGTDLSSADPISHFVVGLYDEKSGFMCTGSLIREDLVLTAAHCVDGAASNIVVIFDVNFAAYDAKNVKVLRKATHAKVHSDYKTQNSSSIDWHDIAVIQFTGGLPEGYKPVQILADSSLLKRDSVMHVAGYGATGVELEEVKAKKDKKFRDALDSGDVFCSDKSLTYCFRLNFLGSEHLRHTEVSIEGLSETEIMTNESNGHGTCVGDSGGPMLHSSEGGFLLAGITSRGSEMCNGPAIYTSVAAHKTWIEQALSELK